MIYRVVHWARTSATIQSLAHCVFTQMKNMYVLGMLAVSFIVGAAPRTVSSSPDIDVVACTGLGFPAVACSTCQTIADIVDDEGTMVSTLYTHQAVADGANYLEGEIPWNKHSPGH